jgi:hypothetical protein
MGQCKDLEGEAMVLSRRYEGSHPVKLMTVERNLRRSGNAVEVRNLYVTNSSLWHQSSTKVTGALEFIDLLSFTQI